LKLKVLELLIAFKEKHALGAVGAVWPHSLFLAKLIRFEQN